MSAGAGLERVLRTRDVVQFFIVAVVGVRWIPAAAALGPSAVVVWLVVCAALFLPLAFAVVELASRHPEEGGLYVWVSRAFGPFWGFLAAWMYWASNLVYFPALLYFMAQNLLFLFGPRAAQLATSPAYFVTLSLVGLSGALAVNLRGWSLARHLNRAGSWGTWLPIGVLVALAVACAMRFGSATAFTPASFVPSVSLRDLVLWSTLAFGFGGVEAASLMGDEIVDARRTVPRAIVLAGLGITTIYILGTLAVLVTVPASEASGLAGLPQALERAATRLGVPILAPICTALIAIGSVAGVSAWLASTARLPFVAGADRYLPSAFARLHPRWGTPVTALVVQSIGAAAFAVLGQLGTSVKGAYDALVAMGVISYFIPFLLMFAAWIRLQREPAEDGVIRAPGGAAGAWTLGLLGIATTAASIALSLLPAPDSANPARDVAKVVGASAALLAIGAGLYASGSRRARRG